MLVDKRILDTLRHASNHSDNERTLALHCAEMLQPRHNFLLGIVTDGTGVQQNGIRFIYIFRRFIADSTHNSCNHLAVCNIHLASVSFNPKPAFPGIISRM